MIIPYRGNRPLPNSTSLIRDALEQIGIYGPGDALSSADANRSLSILNEMIDHWAGQNIYVNSLTSEVLPLIIGQGVYTIGPSGGVVSSRPLQILTGPGVASISSLGYGQNYAVNDTGTIAGGTGGTYRVVSIGNGGVVTQLQIGAGGSGYSAATGAATATGGAQPGTGSGLTVNTTVSGGVLQTAAPNGTILSSPVNVVSAIEFQSFATYTTANGLPDTMTYSSTYPLGTLTLLPAPSAVNNLFFSFLLRFTAFPDLVTQYNFAPNVYEALRDSLSAFMAPYFTDARVNETILARVGQAKDFLRYQGITSRAGLNRFVLTSNPGNRA